MSTLLAALFSSSGEKNQQGGEQVGRGDFPLSIPQLRYHSQYSIIKVAESLTSNKATAEQRLEEQKGRFRYK